MTGDLSVALTVEMESKFTGHPSAQFQQGTKQGGTYKCGVCVYKEMMFNDKAHSVQYTWRDLQTLQTVAIGGVHGKEAGAIKPFDNLKIALLQTELTDYMWNVCDITRKRKINSSKISVVAVFIQHSCHGY